MPKNFSAKRLMGVDFSGQDLSEADFSGATLNGCQFVGSTLRSASFVSVRGMGCNFDDADLTDAQFEGARFMASTFRDSIIAGSDLDEASLMGCDLSGAINEVADDDVEDDDVEDDDESSASDYVHELNLGWVKLEASDHLTGVTGLMNAHLVDGSWVQTRTMSFAFTDCLIHLVESVDRELLLTVLRPGVSDPYRATLTAGESTSLIDKSDESWHARITNQL